MSPVAVRPLIIALHYGMPYQNGGMRDDFELSTVRLLSEIICKFV